MTLGLEVRLAQLAASGSTTSYGTLARDLGLTGPATIARLTTMLEAMMEADVASGQPLRAALVNARGGDLPAPGFFAKAAALGIVMADPAAFVAQQRRALAEKS